MFFKNTLFIILGLFVVVSCGKNGRSLNLSSDDKEGAGLSCPDGGILPDGCSNCGLSGGQIVFVCEDCSTLTLSDGVLCEQINQTDRAAMPTFNPASSSNITPPLAVSISSTTTGSVIRYTINGAEPDCSDQYNSGNSITINSNGTVRAIACREGMTKSLVNSATYTVVSSQGAVAEPTFNHNGGTFNNPISVTISTTTTGAKVAYTTNGDTPVCNISSSLNAPQTITVSSGPTVTLKAIACKSGMTTSAVHSSTFSLKVAKPVISLLSNPTRIKIETATAQSTIKYKLNSTTSPTCSNGETYDSPIGISSNTNIKTIACKTGMANSDYTTANYGRLFTYQGSTGWISFNITEPLDITHFASGKFTSDAKDDIFAMIKPTIGSGSTVYPSRGLISNGSSFSLFANPGDNVVVSLGNTGAEDLNMLKKIVVGDFSNSGYDQVALLGSKFSGLRYLPAILTKKTSGNPWGDYQQAYVTSDDQLDGLFSDKFKGAVAGKFNDDDKADIVVIKTGLTASSYLQYHVFYANDSNGFNYVNNQMLSCSQCGISTNLIDSLGGDFNSDGKQDIATLYFVNTTQSKINVMLNGGNNGLASPVVWWEGAVSTNKISGRVVTGDFNGDGDTDIAAAFNDDRPSECGGSNYRTKMLVWLNNGNGFDNPIDWWSSSCGVSYNAGLIQRLVAGDFDGDGDSDLAGFYKDGTVIKTHVWLSTIQ